MYMSKSSRWLIKNIMRYTYVPIMSERQKYPQSRHLKHINHDYADDEYQDNADGYVTLICVYVYEYVLETYLMI
jgi:hypothetical protein